MPKPTVCSQGGFTLVEVLVAAAIVATGTSVLAALFILAIEVNRTARAATFATVLAQQKMEQLRGLTWGYDVLGGPASDLTTDISVVPFTAAGPGLSPSPPDTLLRNTAGYVDFVDGAGNWIGTGTSVPGGAVYVRRWAIDPLPSSPNSTLILQVLVTRRASRGGADRKSAGRLPEEARLIGARTRK